MRRLCVVMLVGMLLTGCGGGGDSESPEEAVRTADDGEGSSGDGDDDSGDNDSSDSADAGVGVFTTADCMRAVQALSAAYGAAGLAMSGQTAEIEKTQKEFDALAAKAPREIRSDIETLREAYGEYGRIIEDSGWKPGSTPPPQSVMDEFEEAAARLDSAEVKTANENVGAWFEEECGR
jgi:hypothetical protein